MKSIRWSTIVVIVTLTALPWVVTSDYYRHILIMALMWVVIGSAWNIISGYTGQVSFGHAIFYGTGAYTAGLLTIKLGISPWWGMLLGGPVALVVGLLIGWICFRLRGPYFALATIAIGEIFRLIATVWRDFTEGMQGIMIIRDIQDKIYYYYLALALAGACIFAIHLVMRSKWGYYFVAIREDQDAAEAMGISSFRYKSLALMISSFFAGTAGAFYMNYMAFIDPHVVFSLHHISIMAILVAIIGGVGTLWGPAVGAFIMVLLQETFRSSFFGLAPRWVSEGHVVVFGLLVIVVIRYLANGIVGDWPKIMRIWPKSKELPSASAGN